MHDPTILLLSGSTRPESFNRSLVEVVARYIAAKGGRTTIVDLSDYPMQLIDAAISGGEMPEPVEKLHALFAAHDGVFLATPEYNAFPSPLLLNMLDWLSRPRHYEGGMEEVFGRPLFAIGAASPSPIGGYRALMALRQKLELGLGATVIPAMVHIAAAYDAFDVTGDLKAEGDQVMVTRVVDQFLGRLVG